MQGPGRERSLQQRVMETNGSWGQGAQRRGVRWKGAGGARRSSSLHSSAVEPASQQTVSADGFAVVHSSSMEHCLWQEGISFSNDFSCWVSSGEYEMRVVQGSWLCCVSRAGC